MELSSIVAWVPRLWKTGLAAWRASREELSVKRATAKAELEEMQRRRALEDSVVYREPFFYKGNEETPACPRCWQQPLKNFVYLQPEQYLANRRGARFCPSCGQRFYTGPDPGDSGPNTIALPPRVVRY